MADDLVKDQPSKKKAEKADSRKVRSIFCTWNNYTSVDEALLQELIRDKRTVYGVYGKEIAPTTGTPHLQFYIVFENPRHLSALRKHLSGADVRPQGDSTPLQASYYCRRCDVCKNLNKTTGRAPGPLSCDECKEKEVFEHGNLPLGKGARSDLNEIREAISTGKSITSVLPHINRQGLMYAEKIVKYISPKRSWKTTAIWVYGPTGSGKSNFAYEITVNPWECLDTLKWWDGYDAHEDVIFDDFRPFYCSFPALLRILDSKPYRVEVKGGTAQLLAKTIVITCPDSYYDLYKNSRYAQGENLAQLYRRLEYIVYIDKNHVKHFEKCPDSDRVCSCEECNERRLRYSCCTS